MYRDRDMEVVVIGVGDGIESKKSKTTGVKAQKKQLKMS